MRIWRWGVWLMAALALAGATRAQTVACSSDGAKKYCQVDTRQGAHLVKQRSDAACKQGESWGYDEKGVWVDHGCAADFAPGAAAGAVKIVTCTSDGGKKYCDANTHHGIKLVKQHGDAPCKEGSSWGFDGLGIWVDQGCSADFALGGAAQPAAGGTGEEAAARSAEDKTCLKEAGKARSDQMVKQCLQVSPATHPPCNAQNSCELITDEIRRSCQLLGTEGPGFCSGYLK
jgi:Protein of unknown function (DUF3011)